MVRSRQRGPVTNGASHAAVHDTNSSILFRFWRQRASSVSAYGAAYDAAAGRPGQRLPPRPTSSAPQRKRSSLAGGGGGGDGGGGMLDRRLSDASDGFGGGSEVPELDARATTRDNASGYHCRLCATSSVAAASSG